MTFIKNLSDGVNSLDDLISIYEYQVLSKALSDTKYTDIRLFSISKGEMIRNEIYPYDIIYLCLSGTLKVLKNNKEYILSQNDFLAVYIDDVSSLYGETDVKMLQIMVKE